MDELKNLETMGLTLPSPAYLFGIILFGIVGFALYRFGKKTSETSTKWVGIVMMLYPYFISETWQLYAVGVGLGIGLYVMRR